MTLEQGDSWTARVWEVKTWHQAFMGEGKEKEDWRWEPWATWWLLDVGERLWCHRRLRLGDCEAANWMEEMVKGATVIHLLDNDSILLFTDCIFAFCHIFYTCTLLPTLCFWKKLFAVKIIDFFLKPNKYSFPFFPFILQDELWALAARFQNLSLYSIRHIDVVEAMRGKYFNPWWIAEEEEFMSPILLKFEDNDFCFFCLCFFSFAFYILWQWIRHIIILFSSLDISSKFAWTREGMFLYYFLPF